MTRVRDEQGILPCCWADCERAGSTMHQVHQVDVEQPHREYDSRLRLYVNVPGRRKVITYVFCSERHRMMYVNGAKSFGNLPLGSRGLL